MSNKLHSLAMSVASQFGLSSPLGQWILAASQAIGGGASTGSGCCILGVAVAGGSVSQFVPFPAGCTQPDTNFIVTGVFTGGVFNDVVFAIAAKDPSGFQVAFDAPLPGDVQMDFKVEHC
jgi:hypothetical protein